MFKEEFIGRVTDILRENDTRKPVSVKKQVFHITDDNGNTADFNVRQQDKRVIYTVEDTRNIIDACIAVITDALQHGEDISFKGFGNIGVHYRAARRTKDPIAGEWCEVDARYVPKFTPGRSLKMAARLYELSANDADNQDAVEPEDNEDAGA